jgi:energy-coupling factor transport system ATP-binding protein
VVVLDEPLAGLDPEGRADVVELLGRLRDSGLTLIVISHDVADMAAVCDRTVHLRSGRILGAESAWEVTPVPGKAAAQADSGPGALRTPGATAWRFEHGGR